AVDRARLQHRANLRQRIEDLVVPPPTNQSRPGSRLIQPEDQTHGRRLARPIGTQEPRHDARLDREREILDGRPLAVALRQIPRLNHPCTPSYRLSVTLVVGLPMRGTVTPLVHPACPKSLGL